MDRVSAGMDSKTVVRLIKRMKDLSQYVVSGWLLWRCFDWRIGMRETWARKPPRAACTYSQHGEADAEDRPASITSTRTFSPCLQTLTCPFSRLLQRRPRFISYLCSYSIQYMIYSRSAAAILAVTGPSSTDVGNSHDHTLQQSMAT